MDRCPVVKLEQIPEPEIENMTDQDGISTQCTPC
jgi:hypothetical protein